MAETPPEYTTQGPPAAGQGFLGLIVRRWATCLALPVLLGAGAYFLAGLLPKWYAAQSTVTVAQIDYRGGPMGLQGVTPSDMHVFFTADEVLGKVTSATKGLSKYGIDATDLAESLLTVSVPRGSNRIDVEARMPTPELARAVATAVATEGAAGWERTMQREYQGMLRKFQAQAESTKQALNQAEMDLEKLRVKNRVETFTKRVEAHREINVDHEKRIEGLRTSLAVERAKAAAYEALLKRQDLADQVDRVLQASPPLRQALAELDEAQGVLEKFQKVSMAETLREAVAVQQDLKSAREKDHAQLTAQLAGLKEKTAALRNSLAQEKPTTQLDSKLVKDPAFQQAMASLSGKALQELLALNMSESVVNAVYVALKQAMATGEADEKSVAAQIDAIGQARQKGDEDLTALRTRLFEQERQLKKLQLQCALADKRVQAAADALVQDRGVLTPVYLETVKMLVACKSHESALAAELGVLEQAAGASQDTLAALDAKLFAAERDLRECTFRRDQAQADATKAMTALQAATNIPKWPPVSMTVAPAVLPSTPVSPRKLQIAVAVLLVSGLLLWGLALFLDRRPGVRMPWPLRRPGGRRAREDGT